AVPAAENAFKNCDCLLAVGTRFSEIATGSFGITPPKTIIHIDINPEVFNANYKTEIGIEGDSKIVLEKLVAKVKALKQSPNSNEKLKQQIAQDKKDYLQSWYRHDSKERVNPAKFFSELRKQLPDDGFVIADDGNHTFLTAELMPIHQPRHFISPTDFNCMGYAIPATIATKLAHPKNAVVGIIGDGAFLMTAMEILTAARLQLGALFTVFNDGELSQISQAQNIPYNKKTCTVLGNVNFAGIADATGAEYIRIDNDSGIETGLKKAFSSCAQNKPVILDVMIDYTKRTRFTEGIVGTNLKRLPTGTKVRMVSRALWRRVVN
ncbi:MAG TPA: thiamine pyrophosphate-dependent enzyme, partial [Pseudomonadales bacterium]|nr:thiamine pyrophosphate-dependent enzyme [Pseudomonadales bacterium]